MSALSGILKPLIVRQRTPPEFEEITDTKSGRVFTGDKYRYGIRCRGSFGGGPRQQAAGFKAPLTAANAELMFETVIGAWSGGRGVYSDSGDGYRISRAGYRTSVAGSRTRSRL